MARIYNFTIRRGERLYKTFQELVDDVAVNLSSYTPAVEWFSNSGVSPGDLTVELESSTILALTMATEETSELKSGGDYVIWLVDGDDQQRELVSGYISVIGEPRE